MGSSTLEGSVRLKLDLMFEGLRFTPALGDASKHAFPNFFPYRFTAGEHDPTGTGRATIPYMLVTDDDTHVRIKGNHASSWWIDGSRGEGYRLQRDGSEESVAIDFEPDQPWMQRATSDGLPAAQAGISLHGDMAVINVAPGCDYFRQPLEGGGSMRCTFCTYGAPDSRTKHLGQVMGQTALPDSTYLLMQEVLAALLDDTPVRHIFLVGGSLVDPAEEGVRYTELARRVQEVVGRRVPVMCGSGALPDEHLRTLHGEGLVDGVCFNLETWSEPLFQRVCPGKNHYVGYARWIEALERSVALWGAGRVYSAMVAGIELGADIGLDAERAVKTALDGAAELCNRGILPIYSLFFPPAGRELGEQLRDLRTYFERLSLGYAELRQRHDLRIWDGFMCHRCAYMQLDCDIDRSRLGHEVT